MSTQYHVYGNSGSGEIDYSTVLATVAGLSWTTGALTAGTWLFAVRAFDTVSGLEESNVDAVVPITIDSGLADISAVPAPPAALAVVATESGGAHVTWSYPVSAAPPTGFHVYIGAPTVSYITPVATKLAGIGGLPFAAGGIGQVRYKVDLTGLSDGSTYQVGVRAYNAVGEEGNTVVATVVGNTAAPANVANLTAS